MKPFNLAQLSHMIATIEQHRQGFNESSVAGLVAGHAEALNNEDFNSRNLGTGRPTIQCTACGEYSHWRRECPYNNFCTTCNNHNHTTHMCRAPKQTPKQSPAMCVYCGSMEHSSSQCHNRPWDNREQLCITPEAIRNQKFQCANSKISGSAGSC